MYNPRVRCAAVVVAVSQEPDDGVSAGTALSGEKGCFILKTQDNSIEHERI